MIELICDGCEITQQQRSWIENAIEAALNYEGRTGDVAVTIITLEQIHEINRNFRNVDAPTDVLSFPAWEGADVAHLPDGFLGDIAICLQRACEQAEEYGHSLARELAFLAVHGTLHLLGYDHMKKDEEKQMFERQEIILERMGLVRE